MLQNLNLAIHVPKYFILGITELSCKLLLDIVMRIQLVDQIVLTQTY